MSYLAKYLAIFGETKLRCVEHIPYNDIGDIEKRHIEIIEIGTEIADISENFTHPCWCNPELIYADDEKGNEVWRHNRMQ